MKSIVAATLLLMIVGSAQAGREGQRDMRFCLVEVLHSEELPIGPLFHHSVKTALLVTAPNRPPFETIVHKVIPWQVPPPRQGQRMRVRCDPAVLNSSFGLF
jgi:hypothetical protein